MALTGGWQEIWRTEKALGGGTESIIFYAYANENVGGNYSNVHTLIRLRYSGNSLKMSSWSAASDTTSTGGGYTSWAGNTDYNLLESSWNVGHADNGTGSVSIGMSFSSTYGITSASWRGTVDLQTIPRQSSVSQSFNSKTETTITMNTSMGAYCNGIWYSLNGGGWQGTGIVPGTGCTYTISELSANTTYSIRTRVQRQDSGMCSETGSTSITTYAYPYITSSPSFTIGNDFTIGLYNPLSRNCSITLKDDSETVFSQNSTTSTSLTFSSSGSHATFLQNSIPNSTAATYSATLDYNGNTSEGQGHYYIDQTASRPVFTANSLSHYDTNSAVVAISGSNQKIVQNKSTPRFSIKASAKNGASLKKAIFNINGTAYTSASASNIYVDTGTINLGSNFNAYCTITDSRGLSNTTVFTVVMTPYAPPTAILTVTRRNNYYNETTINIDSAASAVGSNTCSIKYKAVSGSTTIGWKTASDNVPVTESLDNTLSWDITAIITDSFGSQSTYEKTLQRGVALMFLDNTLQSVGVGTFPTKKNSVQVLGAVEMANLLVEITTDGWSSSPTFGSYYTYKITCTTVYKDHPNISLSPTNTIPDTNELIAYSRLDDAVASGSTITLYAQRKPANPFYINIEGAR